MDGINTENTRTKVTTYDTLANRYKPCTFSGEMAGNNCNGWMVMHTVVIESEKPEFKSSLTLRWICSVDPVHQQQCSAEEVAYWMDIDHKCEEVIAARERSLAPIVVGASGGWRAAGHSDRVIASKGGQK